MNLITGKYKLPIIFIIYILKSVRYSKLSEILAGVTDKTLSENLKSLQDDGFIKRELFDEMPLRVEHRLTKKR